MQMIKTWQHRNEKVRQANVPELFRTRRVGSSGYDVRWRSWAGAQRFFVSSRERAARREMRKFHKEMFVLGYEISGQLDYKILPAVHSRGRADSERFFKIASCKTRAGLLLALRHWKGGLG